MLEVDNAETVKRRKLLWVEQLHARRGPRIT